MNGALITSPTSTAETLFKRTEALLAEGEKAMPEYEARARAMRAKTARLRALRLARDAAGATG